MRKVCCIFAPERKATQLYRVVFFLFLERMERKTLNKTPFYLTEYKMHNKIV
ncbi:hypothetical protein HMPREF1321_1457 [Capnocytophaga sp. oral taxon 412 str. F0487]|nr:hypothetical protein HMPREF1321_1457 [Capnocytophaga sp. oral taxon 412 str. F0487]